MAGPDRKAGHQGLDSSFGRRHGDLHRIQAELIEDAPLGAEFFLALTREGTLKVDSVSSSYISSDQLLTEPIAFEHREPRLEGVVTVRTGGRGLGRLFVYKQDRTSNPSHSVVARVTLEWIW